MNRQRMSCGAFLGACLAFTTLAWAQGPEADSARLSAQYAAWAGGNSNAEAIVTGLHTGKPITLVTTAPDRSVSLAGFTPAAPMSYAQIRAALASAQQSLSRMGVSRPTAEQLQTALIGGDLALPGGSTRQVAGVLTARAPG